MRKIVILSMLTVAFATQQVCAQNQVSAQNEGNSCRIIAQACMSAGFGRKQNDPNRFWEGCMKPILHNQKVPGVKVNSSQVQACRNSIIAKMKKDLSDLENVK